jgi:putative ABC transport system permease protein
MSAPARVVRGGLGRRRLQTTVTVLTVLMAVTASVLAAGLLVASRSPFEHAFARWHGAHLAVQFDGTRATTAQLAPTTRLAGVTEAAGPFPTVALETRTTTDAGPLPAGVDLPEITVVGRSQPTAGVDDLRLLEGRWARKPGEMVLASGGEDVPPHVGLGLEVPAVPGSPRLTVVGVAQSMTGTADAWVTPAGLRAVTPPGTKPDQQVLYRFSAAATKADIAADRAAVAAAVPPGALEGAQSYLTVEKSQEANTAAYVPFVLAFGLVGLALSTLVVGIVVSGAVGAATRRIGVLRSLGFTPGQVVRAYVGQALIPAAVGVAGGVALANVLAVPILDEQSSVYGGTAVTTIPVGVDVAVGAAALVLVAVTALVPALRAGRLRPVEAIAVGRTPSIRRGRRVRRLAGRLPLPRPLSLGLADPFAHPGRTATIAGAVVFGALTTTFAVGVALSLDTFEAGRDPNAGGAVVVDTQGGPLKGGLGAVVGGPGSPSGQDGREAGAGQPTEPTLPSASAVAPPAPADPAEVAAALRAQPGTRRFYGMAFMRLHVAGITGSTTVVAYDGDTSWAPHRLISGHWLTGPGQALVNTRFLDAAGLDVGDTLTVSNGSHRTQLRLVGEVLDINDDGMDVHTELASLDGLGLDAATAAPGQFLVDLDPGTDVPSYLDGLNARVAPLGAEARVNPGGGRSEVIATMHALAVTLTLMLLLVAGLGVLNVVVLDTRARAHDLGVFKAVGMTPRQTIAMVISAVAAVGLVAGLVGVPLGVALHHVVLPRMGAAAGTGLPPSVVAVYHGPLLALLALGGLVIGVGGALLPSIWAVRSPTQAALRTE